MGPHNYRSSYATYNENEWLCFGLYYATYNENESLCFGRLV